LFLGHDHGAALCTHDDLVLGALEVLHIHGATVTARSEQSRFVNQVGQVSTGETGRTTSQHHGVHVGGQRHFAHVYFQNLLATTDVRQADHHLTVKTARTQQSGVQYVRTVGSSNDQYALAGFKTVHFNQQLVECLFALIVTTAQTSTTLTAHGVNFVDKDDARRLLLGGLEHVANAGSTHTHKHFHEIRTGNAEERHFGFASNGTSQQGFTGTGRANHQDTAGDTATQTLEASRVTQEIHQFLYIFLGFVATSNVGKGNWVSVLVQQTRTRLAKAECPALATTLHLAHEKHPHANQEQHGEPGDEQAGQEGRLFAGFARYLHTGFHQFRHHPQVTGGRQRVAAARVRRDMQGIALNIYLADASGTGIIHELRVSDAISGWWPAVKLLENSKQHQRNNHPDRDFGKRIVQSQSPAIAITCQICLHIPEQAPYIVHSTRFKDRQVINYLPFKPRATRKVSAD